ncbi:LAFA_0G23772g1_1 [Lachancea sp. 'fantastica']|nr:LAFA_0G23772g1_1 [Lachancea sp. 'fantastica']
MSSTSRRIHRKTGCVPCKIRKKKCSEHKPECTDCARLGITCIYLPERCPREKINFYREQVEEALLERRRLKSQGTFSGNSSIVNSALEKLTAEHNSEAQLATTAFTTTRSTDLWPITPCEEIMDDSVDILDSIFRAPSPLPSLSEPWMMKLDDTAMHLYSYYRDSLSQIISIAPSRQNYYLKIFLPMAHQNEGILYGILAWAAHHLSLSGPTGGGNTQGLPSITHVEESSPAALDETFRDVTEHGTDASNTDMKEWLVSSPLSSSDSSSSSSTRQSPRSFRRDSLDRELAHIPQPDPRYTAVANEYTLYSLQKIPKSTEEGLLPTLANLLVLCGAEICQGDIERWRVLLRYAARIIKDHTTDSDIGELLAESEKPGSKMDAKVTRWLLSNFAYHDILGSDKTHFPMQQYSRILEEPALTYNYPVDPLYGINRPIFQILGQVKNLARKVKQELGAGEHVNGLVLDGPLYNIIGAAQRLQISLYSMQPIEYDLAWYETSVDSVDDARSLAKILYSVFRTTALLHLKTAVMRQPKDCYDIQYLVLELSNDLDKVLGTKLESGLCFPLFICGVNSFHDAQRQDVESKFTSFLQRYKFRNVERAFAVMKQLWYNCDIGREQDWYDVVDEIGWDLNFA